MNDPKATCQQSLRDGEALSEPFDWTIRHDQPVWVVEAGCPVVGDSFNAFAEGWGETPEKAYNALAWKLTERNVSGCISFPYGLDRHGFGDRPTVEEVAKVRQRRQAAMTPWVRERYDKEYQPERIGLSRS